MTNNFEYGTLELPDDISLPFFAYGIFKPRQVAYSKIKNHVDADKIRPVKVNYLMKHRDGVPILVDGENEYHHTEGTLLTFRPGHEKDAYYTIARTLSEKLYEWKIIMINGKRVNALFGVNPDYGSNYIESRSERVNFNGKNDPFFDDALKLIEKNLNSNNHSSGLEPFFELQMNYMLLWSAIERYSSIKYNKSKGENNRRFAKQKAFREGIKKFEDEYHHPVFSTEDLRMHEFDANDENKTLYYYYTFRCNIVHRGKSMRSDYVMLKQATEELLEIFKNILEDTFDGE